MKVCIPLKTAPHEAGNVVAAHQSAQDVAATSLAQARASASDTPSWITARVLIARTDASAVHFSAVLPATLHLTLWSQMVSPTSIAARSAQPMAPVPVLLPVVVIVAGAGLLFELQPQKTMASAPSARAIVVR